MSIEIYENTMRHIKMYHELALSELQIKEGKVKDAKDSLASMKENPYQFPECTDEYLKSKKYREAIVTNMQYVVIYRVEGWITEKSCKAASTILRRI